MDVLVYFEDSVMEISVDEASQLEVEIVTKLNLLLEWQKSSVEFHRFSKKFEEYIAVHPSD